MNSKVNILNIRFDSPNKDRIRDFLRSNKQNIIYTPNAEMLVFATRDSNFRDVLNRSSMNICDGSGPAYMARMFEKKKVKRVSGTDFLYDVLQAAASEGSTVFLLGSGDDGVLSACDKKFESEIVGLSIVGTHPGIQLDVAETNGVHSLVYDETKINTLCDQINTAAPDVLIVAFGHPKQELFMDEFTKKLPSVRLVMGVGGALDFYAGKVRRAPMLLRRWGLESVWRLILQPWRWKRVFTALVIFPILYLQSRYTRHGSRDTNV